MTETPIYDAVKADLDINPIEQLDHNNRVAHILDRNKSKILPNGHA